MASTKYDPMWKLMMRYHFEAANDGNVEHLKCILCKKLLIDACRSSCNCQYCYKCIMNYLDRKKKFCPGGKEECLEDYLLMDKDVQRNKSLNHSIYKLDVKCPNKWCQTIVVLSQMDEHLRSCETLRNQCPFTVIGCSDISTDPSSMVKHLDDEKIGHSRLLAECVRSLRDEMRMKDSEIMDLKTEVRVMRDEMNHLKTAMGRQDGSGDRRMSAMKGSKRVGFTPSVDRNDGRNPGVDEEVVIGTLNFTVDNFSARKEANVVILSPYFYSHMNGYKLRLRIYPDGFNERRSFLSVHFVLCKGKHDEALSWPCRYRIDICVVNQSTGDTVNHRVYDVDTIDEVGKELFNRPLAKDNLPCGHNTFMSHKDLEAVPGLIVDDKVVLRCCLSAPL